MRVRPRAASPPPPAPPLPLLPPPFLSEEEEEESKGSIIKGNREKRAPKMLASRNSLRLSHLRMGESRILNPEEAAKKVVRKRP